MDDKDEIREQIQRRYAKVAMSGSAGGCCSGNFTIWYEFSSCPCYNCWCSD